MLSECVFICEYLYLQRTQLSSRAGCVLHLTDSCLRPSVNDKLTSHTQPLCSCRVTQPNLALFASIVIMKNTCRGGGLCMFVRSFECECMYACVCLRAGRCVIPVATRRPC